MPLETTRMIYATSPGPGNPLTGTNASFTLIQGLPHNPEATEIVSAPTGSMYTWGAPRPVPFGTDSIVHLSMGPDIMWSTADDEIVIVRNLGGSPQVESWPAGMSLGSTVWSRAPIVLRERVVVPTHGPDSLFGTTDDGLMAISKLNGGNPQFTYIPLGNAALEVKRVHDSGVWAMMLIEAPVYVSGLQSPFPSLNPMPEMLPYTGSTVAVNDWTQFTTAPGVIMGNVLNDSIKVLTFSYVESLGTGTSGALGMTPLLTTVTFPSVAAGWYPILMDGANPSALSALVFSRWKDVYALSPTTTLFIDPDEIVVTMDGVTDPMGSRTFLIQLPTDPSLSGRSWAVQGFVIDPFATDGFTVTNGLVLHL